LAETVLDLAREDVPEGEQLPLALALVEYYRQSGQHPRADALLTPLLSDKQCNRWPALWRLAAVIAEARGMTARALGHRQRALELACEQRPEQVNVETLRRDYDALLGQYQKLATAIGPIDGDPPRELVARVVRAADHWRQLDPDPTPACQAAARILGDLGAAELAWDYLTTPLSARPNEAAPWESLAKTLRQQGHIELADRAYASAFEAEPTNAQLLWDRAQSLWESGRREPARKLLRQLADGQWQPRFGGLQSQAKERLDER
jgi:tetratricopeptide (TPR) repeat protein